MSAPRALIAEDEPLLASALRAALAGAWPELEVVHVAANGDEALEKLLALAPEVAFLDIRMPGRSGLEVAEDLADRLPGDAPAPLLVFVTAHGEFALEAFDRSAMDYLLKPVSAERLARCVARLQQRLAAPARGFDAIAGALRGLIGAPDPAAEPLRILRAGHGQTVKMIPLDAVCYFRASDKLTEVVTREGGHLIRTPLARLEAQLPRGRFCRVHRNAIVNLDAVSAAVRDDSGRLSLRLRERAEMLPVSRVYAELFRQM